MEAVQLAAFLARAAGEGAARGRGTARPRVECARAATSPYCYNSYHIVSTTTIRYTWFCINVTTVAPLGKIVNHRYTFHSFQCVSHPQLFC